MAVANAGWMPFGDVEIAAVWDGTLKAELKTIVGLDPAESGLLIDAEAHALGSDPLTLPVRAFAIKDGSRVLLADTGSGLTKGPTMGFLPQSLAALGLTRDAIDTVLLTHLHMDHIGGLVDADGLPAFPRAEIIVHAAEARYFLDLPPGDVDSRSQRHLEAQRAILGAYGNRVRRVEDGGGIGCATARLAPGHTPGHTVWDISSNGLTAMVIGDVVHLGAVQLPRPLTAMIYDVDPARAGRSRLALLDEAARVGTLVAGAHLPGEGLGYIVGLGDGFGFVPARS